MKDWLCLPRKNGMSETDTLFPAPTSQRYSDVLLLLEVSLYRVFPESVRAVR